MAIIERQLVATGGTAMVRIDVEIEGYGKFANRLCFASGMLSQFACNIEIRGQMEHGRFLAKRIAVRCRCRDVGRYE